MTPARWPERRTLAWILNDRCRLEEIGPGYSRERKIHDSVRTAGAPIFIQQNGKASVVGFHVGRAEVGGFNYMVGVKIHSVLGALRATLLTRGPDHAADLRGNPSRRPSPRRLTFVSTAPAAPASPSPSPTGPGPVESPGQAAMPAWIRYAMLANLVAQIGIVVTGGLVRVTGSGLGCPTWPQCVPGSFTPVRHQAESYHKYIEFGNRTLTSVVTLTAVLALLAAVAHRRRVGAGRRWTAVGAAPVALVLAQAVIGGVTVLLDLSPAWVSLHFLVSIALVVVSGLLYLGTGAPVPVCHRPELRRLTAALSVLAVVVLCLGTLVTGAGPHSGDADTPSRFNLDPRGMSWLHADVVMLFVGLVVALVLVVRLTAAGGALWRRSLWLLGVTLAQGVVGYLQYFTDLPILLVVLHMLGAALLTLAMTAVAAAVIGTKSLTGG